ncbi:MAG: arginine deiminase-related protein [Paludibacter sp.]|nr:arginine deiminase-related protein [Paludibacter sp.]
MEKQATNTVVMIEPVAFGFNKETAVNNFFQRPNDQSAAQIQQQALKEFTMMVQLLREKGIRVHVIKDTSEPHTPDSIFPNNPISFLEDGRVVLYPMFAENRRHERQKKVLHQLMEQGVVINGIVDFTHHEQHHRFLEGTGSMVFDHENKIAYAALSERTDRTLFELFCGQFGYQSYSFYAFQSVGSRRLPVYHTNVMMCVAGKYVVVCMKCIDNIEEREELKSAFIRTGKEIIEISEAQMHCFAGNMLQLRNSEGNMLLALSESAYNALDQQQIQQLKTYNELIVIPVPNIEKYGGGSVRCMMLEVFGVGNTN